MISLKQFKEEIVEQTLAHLKLGGDSAVELLLGTAIQESRLQYLVQLGGGPARGVFQMEPATHDDIWENFLAYRPTLVTKIKQLVPLAGKGNSVELVGNLWYAATMCRVHYLRVSAALPEAGDTDSMAAYWKEHYNTILGAGTEEEYIENWEVHGPNKI